MGLNAVLAAIRKAVNDCTNAAEIAQRGETLNGWPTAPQLVDILGSTDNAWQITLYPMPGRNATRYIGEGGIIMAATVLLTRTIAGAVLTFGGSIPPTHGAVNIHSFIKGTNEDIFLRGNPGQNPTQIAAAVAQAVNDAAIPGVSATASGPAATLTGATWEFCNIGGVGKIAARGEVLRVARMLQVSIWTTGGNEGTDPDGQLRMALYDAITERLGNAQKHFVTLPDGSSAFILYQSDSFDDDSQSSYSLYVAHITFELEYGLFYTTTATQVGDIAATTSVNGQPAGTNYIGGTP